jgi:hypothetical protein
MAIEEAEGVASSYMEELVFSSTLFWVALLWQLPWKAVALWRAARNHQMGWYIVMFIVSTMAILEIIYLFKFSKPKPQPTAVAP